MLGRLALDCSCDPLYALPPVNSSKPVARPVLVYRFGPYELEPATNELRKFGSRVKIERKPLQLLLSLIERSGQIVTRDDLRRSLWRDDLFVDFEKGLNVAVTKLRAALNDSPDRPTWLETIPGAGYRFKGAVEEVYPPQTLPVSENPEHARASAPVARRRSWRAALSVAVLCLSILVIAGILVRRTRHREPSSSPGKHMLVVLPFENFSGDPGQEYLSDGLTEELSAKLGNLNPQQLGVIGRTSAMAYKHSHATIGQIGKELGVDYVLEGSVRRAEDRLRVTAQLVRVSDQAHVWAEDYDRDAGNLLQLEDEVAGNIAQRVGVSIALM